MALIPQKLADLRVPHCVRLATYHDDAATREELRRWEGAGRRNGPPRDDQPPIEEAVQKLNLPDVVAVLHQARIDGAYTAEEAARLCLQAFGCRPLPAAGRLGLTSVVLARVERSERDRSAEAAALLAALTGASSMRVQGGPLAPAVELWAPKDDLGWLLLLCDDDDRAEAGAASRLYGELWVAEVGFHKVCYQHDLVAPARRRLESERATLQGELDHLAAALEQPDQADSPEALRTALDLNGRTTKAQRALIETAGRLRMMRTSLEANRANLLAFRSLLGDEPGRTALDARLQRTDQAIWQIRTDLGYCKPLLRAVRDICELHRTGLMTVMSIGEMEAGRRRAKETARHNRFARWLSLGVIWIGLTQVANGVLTNFYKDAGQTALKALVLAGPTLLAGTALAAWGIRSLARRWPRGDPPRQQP